MSAQQVLQAGKRNVEIRALEPVGSCAVVYELGEAAGASRE